MIPSNGGCPTRHGPVIIVALALALSPPLMAASGNPDAAMPRRSARVRVSQTFDWIATAPAAGILWLGVEEPYRVELSAGCGNLLSTPPQRISVHGHELQPGRDELFSQSGHCRIVHLRPADPQQLQSAGLQRENARPLLALKLTGPPLLK